MGEEHVGHLGGVHHRAAADGEERVGARLLGRLGAARRPRRWTSPAAPRRTRRPPRGRRPSSAGLDPLDQAGAADHLVGDDERRASRPPS